MVVLILIFILVWLGYIAILAAGALFIQGYTNESPPSIRDLAWRAPAAGSAIALFLILWCLLAKGSPEFFTSFTEFSATEERPPYPQLQVAAWNPIKKEYEKNKALWRTYHKRRSATGRIEYRDSAGRRLPSRPDSIIVKDGEKELHFKPERDEDGNFQPRRGLSLRYIDESSGLYMEEGFLGRISVFRMSRWILYLFVNLIHGVIWFLALWLLLLFTRAQAFGLALIGWIITTLLVIPPLTAQALSTG